MNNMLNKYPWWKNLLVILVVVLGLVYSLANLYAPDPAIQINPANTGETLSSRDRQRIESLLRDAGLQPKQVEAATSQLLLRFDTQDVQLQAKSVLERALQNDYVVALNLAATTPQWLANIGAKPMKLGLDLAGGVHFLLEVDTDAVVAKRMNTFREDIRKQFREARIRGVKYELDGTQIRLTINLQQDTDAALALLREEFRELSLRTDSGTGSMQVFLTLSDAGIKDIRDYAISQNLTTLRNRVNELGVAEPLVQRQGANRIVVQLPGIQDTATAKTIIGKAANLEFRLEGKLNEPSFTREQFEFKDKRNPERRAWLEKRVIITGDQVANAQSSFDENSHPQVNISLDSRGGTAMHRATRDNIGRRLGVLFIERKSRIVGYETNADGEEVPIREFYDVKELISLATVQAALGTSFRITGLDNPAEASELALLLRAGALAAPMIFVEERTVGPSLGAENIAKGQLSVQVGLIAVLIFMLLYFKVFGLAANLALAANIVILVAIMSALSATLTLPGIAGIVLTIGMAVDANVLIFARIKEELRRGSSPQTAIDNGYGRAFVTIMDANITTLIVAIILYAVGTGPVQGFAVTLSVGIVTSMFTSILGTRMLINLLYGGRNVQRLLI